MMNSRPTMGHLRSAQFRVIPHRRDGDLEPRSEADLQDVRPASPNEPRSQRGLESNQHCPPATDFAGADLQTELERARFACLAPTSESLSRKMEKRAPERNRDRQGAAVPAVPGLWGPLPDGRGSAFETGSNTTPLRNSK